MVNMTDTEKHEWCKQRDGFGAVILPSSLYRRIEELGYDMRWYVMSKPIPAPEQAGRDCS